MQRTLCVLLVVLANAVLWPSVPVFAEGENIHNIAVSPIKTRGIRFFQVQTTSQVAVLNTTPEDSLFDKDKSRLVSFKRHDNIDWVETKQEEDLYQVKSPPVPQDQASWVLCAGVFKAGSGGIRPPNSRAEVKSWRSELLRPGAHVIVAMQFDFDQLPPSNEHPSYNQLSIFGAESLRDAFKEGGNHEVYIVRCGADGDIQNMSELSDYLQAEDQNVENKSVVTLDTIGHGEEGWLNEQGVYVGEFFSLIPGQDGNGKLTVGHRGGPRILQY